MNEAYQFSVRVLVGASVLAVFGAAVLAWAIGRSITGPVNAAVQLARTVASGDLTNRIAVSGRDEISALLRSLQAMNGSLNLSAP